MEASGPAFDHPGHDHPGHEHPGHEHPGALAGGPLDWSAMRRLLVVRPDNLGDVLLLSPALRAIRAAAPHADVTLLASPAGAQAGPLLPDVGSVLQCSPTWQLAGVVPPPDPARELALVDRVGHGRYDAVLIFTSFTQTPWAPAYVCLLAGVPVRVGTSKEFGGALLTHWVPAPPDELHQVDRALYLLERVGVPARGHELAVRIPAVATTACRDVLQTIGVPTAEPYAVVLPGASCSARRYAAERFAAVARRIAAGGLAVLVAGATKERSLVEAVAGQAGQGVHGVAGMLDVPGLAALLARARVAVTNNSGGMHLADAVRTPLVVTFAGTELEEQYVPRSTQAVLLRARTGCTPCRAFTCPFGHECLDLDPEVVAGAALDLLDGKAAGVNTSGERLAGGLHLRRALRFPSRPKAAVSSEVPDDKRGHSRRRVRQDP